MKEVDSMEIGSIDRIEITVTGKEIDDAEVYCTYNGFPLGTFWPPLDLWSHLKEDKSNYVQVSPAFNGKG